MLSKSTRTFFFRLELKLGGRQLLIGISKGFGLTGSLLSLILKVVHLDLLDRLRFLFLLIRLLVAPAWLPQSRRADLFLPVRFSLNDNSLVWLLPLFLLFTAGEQVLRFQVLDVLVLHLPTNFEDY